MNSEIQEKRSRRGLETVKWLVVSILIIIAVVGNYFYRDFNSSLRAFVVVFIIAIAASIAIMTSKGRFIIAFAREARIEVRKVIWPTRHETLHTTLVVIIVTAVMSLILWGLDSILIRFISFITGLRF